MVPSSENIATIERMDDWILEGYWNESNLFEISKVIHRHHKKKLAQLYYEYELAHQLDVPTVIKPHTIVQEEQFLKMSYLSKTPFISLAEFMSVPLSTYNFLKVSIKITNCFIDLHQASYIYRNLHPKHFLINTKTFDVKLFNLEYSYKHLNFKPIMEPENAIPKHRLAYLAPEETGRVNSEIDFRTDLYSLGVLFYEIIAGQTPYDEKQPAFFNKMLTTDPPTFKQIGIKVPPIIEKIIRKLLSKNKEDRYQSAIGLKEDLIHCLHLFTNDLPLHDFALGIHDRLGESRLSAKIPSRERILNTLLQTLQTYRATQQIHFITGAESSGKSYFLSTLYNALQLKERYLLLLSNNSTHIQTKVPIFILAMRQQLEHIQKMDEKRKSLWEEKLLQSNIVFPRLIVNYFPQLELYAHQLTFTEDIQNVKQAHLFSILVQLINIFHADEMPATFLIDDWETLDYDSLQFIFYLMHQKENYSFIITSNIKSLHEQQPFPSNYTLFKHTIDYLTEAEVTEWVQHSFNSQDKSLQHLAQFLFEMTKGSPLLIQQFFWQMTEQKLLKYDHYKHKWHFDVSSSQLVGSIPAFRGIVEKQLDRLTDEHRLVLKYASCIGNTFQVDMLLNIVPLPQETTLQIYLSLVDMHFFIAKQEDIMLVHTFISLNIAEDLSFPTRFFNKDVFDAVIDMTSQEEASTIHYAIYRNLMKTSTYLVEQDRLIIHHLSHCQDQLNDEEMHMYLQLNYKLGCETIGNGMYRESLTFAQEAFTTLTSKNVAVDYQFALEIYVLYASALYLNNMVNEANTIFEKSLQQCQTLYDRLFVYNEKILFHMMERAQSSTLEELYELLELANQALKPFKIPLKARISNFQVAKEYLLLKRRIKNHSSSHFLQLPKVENKEIQLILKMLMNILGVALIIDEKLYAWINMRAIRLIHTYGDIETASVFYGNYANILMNGFKNFDESYRFASLSVEHLEKHQSEISKGNVYLNFGVGISSLKKPYDTSIYYLKQLQKLPIDDSLHRLYNSIGNAHILCFMMFQGINLNAISAEYLDSKQAIEATNNEAPIQFTKEIYYWLHILQNTKETIDWQLPIPQETRVSFWESHLILRLQMSYLLFETEQAESILHDLKYKRSSFSLATNQPHYHFYYALWLFRKLDETKSNKEKSALLKKVKYCMKQLNFYAKHNPQNFEHYALLIKALYFQHTNHIHKAIFHFDRAIQLAKLSNNARDEAIAKLNTALFYESQRDASKAQLYMESAIHALYAWKAPRIIQFWAERFSHLLKKNLFLTESTEARDFNNAQIIEMYETITRESEVPTLLQKGLFEIMHLLDAEQIYFFQMIDKKPILLAYANSVKKQYDYYEHETDGNLPETVFKAVQEAISTETFSLSKPDFAHIGSVLSLPLFINGQLEAVIYCSNDLVVSLFTKQKIDVVTILATQMILAMENIERQKALEMQVATRTQELSNANEQLQHMNHRLQQNEEELKRFIQHISHDLRTPITSVLGYVEALSGNLVKSEEKKKLYLERSKIRLLALNQLIQDLFDISQLEGGRIIFHKEELSAKQFFTMVDTAIQHDLEHAAIHYVRSYKGEDALIHVDVKRFMQVISNMTNNISKYANEGTVQLSMICDGKVLEIILQDEGRGIPTKDLPFVFDLNFKASNNQNNKDSYGIGLAICKQIVGHHNGTIQVASEENKGTAFTITLPCTPLKDEPASTV